MTTTEFRGASAEHRRGRGVPHRRILLPVLSLTAVLGAWEVAAQFASEQTVPGFEDLPDAFKSLAFYWKGGLGVESTAAGGELTWLGAVYSLLHNSGVTAARMLAGLGMGIIAGVGLAVIVSWSRVLREMFALPAHLARMTPLLAAVPLFELWFGATDLGAIIFVAFGVAILMFVIALTGISNVPHYYFEYARSLGASSSRAYFGVVLPASVPALRGGLLISVGVAWSCAIAAELFGQPYGLGHIVVYAEFFSRVNVMGLAALLVLVYAGVSFWAAARLIRWLTVWAD